MFILTSKLITVEKKKPKIILCSQCNESFENGYDYRMHWETHLDDFFKHGIEYCEEKREKIKNYNTIS